jgi:hypothetical protein
VERSSSGSNLPVGNMEMKTARLAKAPSAVAMRDEMTFGQNVS